MKAPNQQHQSQGQQPAMAGGWGGRPGAGPPPPSKSQNQSPGWTAGPVPRAAGPGAGGVDPAESSGWDEPSPQSISRKMEIDDGTSAWGDPQRYSNKNVNMWDKNSGSGGQGSGGPGPGGPGGHGPQGPSPPNPQQPPRRQPPSRESGNGGVGQYLGLFWGGLLKYFSHTDNASNPYFLKFAITTIEIYSSLLSQ